MPKMIAIGTVTMLAVSAGLYALAGGGGTEMAHPLMTQAPYLRCAKMSEAQPKLPLLVVLKEYSMNCYQDDSGTTKGVYISFADAKTITAALGLKTQFLDDKNQFYVLEKDYPHTPWFAQFKRDGVSYMEFSNLLSIISGPAARQSTLTGYAQPTLNLKDAGKAMSLGKGGDTFGHDVYWTLAQSAPIQLVAPVVSMTVSEVTAPAKDVPWRQVATGLKAGEVVVAYLLTGTAATTDVKSSGTAATKNQLIASIGVTDAQGSVKLQVPSDAHFLNAPLTQPGKDVLLIRLTNTPLNNLKSGIFLPKS